VNARENVPMRVPRTKFAFVSPSAIVPRKHAAVVALIQLTVRHTLLSSVLPITTVPERSYGPKFRPWIVVIAPPVGGVFEVPWDRTGASQVNKDIPVPETAPTVITT